MTKDQLIILSGYLEKTEKAHAELLAELGNKRAGNWEIINNGLILFKKARSIIASQIKEQS